MAAVNVCLQGNVGADPVTHTFDNGNSVTSFPVGVSQGYYDQSHQWVDQGTMWVDVECAPGAAKQLPWVGKGVRVLVYGLLSQRSFTRKDGTQGTRLRLYAQALGFLNKTNDQQQQTAPQQTQASPWGGGNAVQGGYGAYGA